MVFEQLKKNILKINKIIYSEINIIDESGVIVFSSNKDKLGEKDLTGKELKLKDKTFVKKDHIYINITSKYSYNYYISIKGQDNEQEKYLQLISIFMSDEDNIITKEEFIRDLILGNISEENIDEFCKRYLVDFHNEYQVIVIKNNFHQIEKVKDILLEIYPNELIIEDDKKNLAFILNLNNEYEYDLGLQIYNIILSELLIEMEIGIGTKIDNLKSLHISYTEALLSIELGNKFFSHRKVYNYRNLLIPLLIKNSDINYLTKILKDIEKNMESIFNDLELNTTVIQFFENNLNISESARKLYIHRNTLNYRLNKIVSMTGYDLRRFEDAVNFKTMMHVYDYLKNYLK